MLDTEWWLRDDPDHESRDDDGLFSDVVADMYQRAERL
jgi:hypothetical protein